MWRFAPLPTPPAGRTTPLLAKPEAAVVVDPDGRQVLLLVEDEPSYQDALSVGLTVEGFVVVIASTLAEARARYTETNPDLVLLDLMLPDGSGVDYCRELVAQTSTPVIMVTARTEEIDIILGLEIGAADYVTKPYRLRELVARIRAVLRRPRNEVSADVVTFGTVSLDTARRTCTRDGVEIDLSRKEFDLLVLLAARRGQVVTRDEAFDSLWWGADLSDSRTLDTHVKRIRQKIEVDPSNPTMIITVRGVGFRLDA